MKRKITTLMVLALTTMLTITPAIAATLALNSSNTVLGNYSKMKCSTGLTCTLSGGQLTVVSSPTLTGTTLSLSSTLAATGNFSINTNKFNVTASSGNTTVAGTLGVTGAVSASSTVDSAGNFSVATNKFNVTAGSGNTTVAGTLGVTGATTFTGGVATSSGANSNFMAWKPSSLTSGTSTQASATHVYVTQVFIPYNATLTGVYVNNGATVGTNKYVAILYSSSGAVLANSTTAGITTSGADAYQQLAFAATYAAVGPAIYYVGLQVNGTTDRFRTVPAVGQYGGFTADISGQTFGTAATITPPTTFTADVGPVVFTY